MRTIEAVAYAVIALVVLYVVYKVSGIGRAVAAGAKDLGRGIGQGAAAGTSTAASVLFPSTIAHSAASGARWIDSLLGGVLHD